ncbi:MAG: prephenate dehydratase [Candidatus Paceibacterota bacterium]|jgi:prephenate dehydratase
MKICIIGGSGNFGQFFTKIFSDNKHEVFSIGRANIKKIKNYVEQSDVVVISVPNEAIKTYTDILGKIVNQKQLVIDISSVMSSNLTAIKKLKCQSVFLHPLFAPNIKKGKAFKYVLAPVNLKNRKLLKEFLNILENNGSVIKETSVENHEKMMAYVQALSHFNSILLTKVLANSDLDAKEIEEFSTTFFRLSFDASSRIFAQKSEIYADIQFNNSYFLDVIEDYEENLREIKKIIIDKDYLEYQKVFDKIIKKLSPLLKESFDESQSLIKNLSDNFKRVGYLGPEGSYSEMAAEFLMSYEKLVPSETIADIISKVNNGELDFGVLPIENSIQGSIIETVDGLYKNKLFIQQELVVPIKHCVAGLVSKIVPEKIEIVMSHPQALGQCSEYINKHFPNAKRMIINSTAQAFKKIIDESLSNAVAIGNKTAALKYNLKIFDEDIQDVENNETKFVLVKKTFNINSKGQVSSFVIVPKKDRSGLLFDILGYFKENNINLNKIESRPLKSGLGKYIFHIDIQGNFKDKNVERAISGIKKESEVIFLGSYNQERYK